jgi:hypothetical protein
MKTNISKHTVWIVAAFFICASFNSCLPLYYAPNSNNAPLFKEKGEGRINTYYSGADEIGGLEIQGALSVSKSVGIMLNTAFMSASDEGSNGTLHGNGYLIEGGAGYYKPFAKNFVFETYGGIGFGGAKNEYDEGGTSQINFTKCFIQPDIGYSIKNVDFGVTSKFSAVFMKVADINGTVYKEDIDYIKANPTSFLWEPSAFVRFGFHTVKLQLQYTFSSNLNNKDLAQETHIASIGLSFNIPAKKK